MDYANRRDPDARREIRELREKNNDLTRMLCSLLHSLNDSVPLSPDLAQWYEHHKKWDRSQGR